MSNKGSNIYDRTGKQDYSGIIISVVIKHYPYTPLWRIQQLQCWHSCHMPLGIVAICHLAAVIKHAHKCSLGLHIHSTVQHQKICHSKIIEHMYVYIIDIIIP